MANIAVHNISDRSFIDVEAKAYSVGGMVVRPGKFINVPEDAIHPKSMSLHGKCLWFGPLPAVFKHSSKSALKAKASSQVISPMSKKEVRSYLDSCSLEILEKYAKCMSPAVVVAQPSEHSYRVRITSALFSAAYEPDPECFFWTGRWKKVGSTFVEV